MSKFSHFHKWQLLQRDDIVWEVFVEHIAYFVCACGEAKKVKTKGSLENE